MAVIRLLLVLSVGSAGAVWCVAVKDDGAQSSSSQTRCFSRLRSDCICNNSQYSLLLLWSRGLMGGVWTRSLWSLHTIIEQKLHSCNCIFQVSVIHMGFYFSDSFWLSLPTSEHKYLNFLLHSRYFSLKHLRGTVDYLYLASSHAVFSTSVDWFQPIRAYHAWQTQRDETKP